MYTRSNSVHADDYSNSLIARATIMYGSSLTPPFMHVYLILNFFVFWSARLTCRRFTKYWTESSHRTYK